MQSINWGVIGAGRFGRVHCRALEAIPQARLLKFCTRNSEHLQLAVDEFPQVTACTSAAEILNDDAIEAVTIATHWQDHYELALAALAAGKHVLLEKPMAASYAQCEQILERAESAAGILMVGQICRFDPRASLAREAILAGEIGRVVAMHAKRNLPVAPGRIRLDKISPLMGDGIHDADLMMWFLGCSPNSVYARNVKVFDYVHPDIGWAMLHFEQTQGEEAIGVIETNWGLPENVPTVIDARLEVVGTAGKLTIDCAQTGLSILNDQGLKSRDASFWPNQHGQLVGILRSEVEYFVDCILRGSSPDVIPSVEAARAVRIMELAEQSARTGQVVTV